jgi:hypothetical protein
MVTVGPDTSVVAVTREGRLPRAVVVKAATDDALDAGNRCGEER